MALFLTPWQAFWISMRFSFPWCSGGVETGGQVMEPIMCPFCGGTNLFQEDDYSLEMDFEFWTIHHWECLDCAQSFDKIEILPASNTFEEINESTIH
jgi:hypothetical protein